MNFWGAGGSTDGKAWFEAKVRSLIVPSGESIPEDLMDLSEIKHSFCTENVQEYNKDWQQCRNKVKNLRRY